MVERGQVDELTAVRLEKLDMLRELGVEPFPRRFDRTHLSSDIIGWFDQLEGTEVRVAGRLVGAIRRMGKAGFARLLDAGGEIQIFFRRDVLGEEGFALYRELDVGDFIGVAGTVVRTQKGEISVEARQLTFLAKAIRPLPEKWHGLSDVEKRYRQRYLDLISNPESRRAFAIRSQVVREVRRFLDERGFVEVETPVLQQVASGAAARPFATHSNALDTTLYLRIALELYLKRCIIGGIERVYEIGRVFRNEGLSFKHNPEFTMLELYQAYADYRDIMELVEQLVAHVARTIVGTTRLIWGEATTIDVSPPWPRRSLRDLLIEHAGVDYADYPDAGSIQEVARRAGLHVEPEWSRAKVIDELMSTFVEPKLMGPIFVVDYPAETTPLAKRKVDRPDEVERFEAYVCGMELANAFSELNDPVEQRRRFEAQAASRSDEDETVAVDEEFLEAVEHGMPPTGGLGIGIDRLVMLLANRPTIREVILFPQLRPRETH